MTDADFFNWAANTGFAMAVAAYLLLRFEAKLDALTQEIHDLPMRMAGQPPKNQSST